LLCAALLKRAFFSVYQDLEEKKIDVEGWANREQAIKIIEQAKQRFRLN